MTNGAVTGLFTHVVVKRLTAVETDASRSNQHEFNGSKVLMSVFGPDQPQRFSTEFVWMPDDGEFLSHTGWLTWYDARARHPTRSEYRLYFPENPAAQRAREGDLLILAWRTEGTMLLLLAPGSGVAAARIFWLFGIETVPGVGFGALDLSGEATSQLAQRLGWRSGENDLRQDQAWAEDANGPLGDANPGVREEVGRFQAGLGTAPVEAAGEDWGDVSLELPAAMPAGIAGAALDRTVATLLGWRLPPRVLSAQTLVAR
ncbi:hypothetical protein ACN2C6_13585 [Caulobacter sp. ErkDOM-YI]|uniref:hypothetical protein n=1 Tax=unclassified Caulobacter TaxID=2648921 RepID=UPI003AF80F80